MPKISIITICFNDKEGLKRTSESVVHQTYKDYEWIVIDGGSTDGSKDEILKYQEHITTWVSEPDKGIYNAMNKGVSKASGDYCIFMNSGDRFCSPKALSRVASDSWTADIVACDMFADFGKKIYAYNEAPQKVNFQRLVIGSIGHQSTFIRTALLKETPYREDFKIASDWVFWCDMILRKHKSYQSINVPIAVFDMNGVSESPQSIERTSNERLLILKDFFAPEIVEHVMSNCNVNSSLDGAYMYNVERVVQKLNHRFLSLCFAHFVRPIVKIYKNFRYRIL